MARLTHYQVEQKLQSYDSKEVTEAVYNMGKMLVDECGQRVDYLDAKSARIAGYIGAVVGLMVSTFPIWTSAIDRWAVYVAATGILVGLIGAGITLTSMWPAKLSLPSDSDWLESDGFADPQRLKKYYISSMHVLISSQETVGASKVSAIKSSQRCLALMALSLLILLGNATYKVAKRPSPPLSGHAALGASSAARCPQSNSALALGALLSVYRP